MESTIAALLLGLLATQAVAAPAAEAAPGEVPAADEAPPGPCAALADELDAARWTTADFPDDPSSIEAKITPACRAAFERKESPELDHLLERARDYRDTEGVLRSSVAIGTLCLLRPAWAEQELLMAVTHPTSPSVSAHCLLGLAATDTRDRRGLVDSWMRDHALRSKDPRRPGVQPAAFVLLARSAPTSYVRARFVELLLEAERREAPGRDALRGKLCADVSLPIVADYCARSRPVLETGFGLASPQGKFAIHALVALVYVLVVHLLRRSRHGPTLLGLGLVAAAAALIVGAAALSAAIGLILVAAAFLGLRLFGGPLMVGSFRLGRALDPGPGPWRTALAAIFAGFYVGVALYFLRPWE